MNTFYFLLSQTTTPIAVSPIQEVGDLLLKLIFGCVSIALLVVIRPLIPTLIKYFEKRTGIDIPPSIEDKIYSEVDRLIPKGVAFVEEQAHKALKAKLPSLTGHEKLAKACEFILEHAQDPALKKYFENGNKKKLEALIEAHLGSQATRASLAPTPVIEKPSTEKETP